MEDDGAPPGWSSPPTTKNVKMESEEPNELLKDDDHSDDESKEIEDDDEDGPPPGWQQSPPSSPLLDMTDLPPSSPLPPTPPLPSSPRGLDKEEEDSDDEGPPPGWDNKCQLKEQMEQLVTPVAATTISSDIRMEDVQQDTRNEDGPQSQTQTHPSRERELVPSDVKVEQEDSGDEGPPPGWDNKYRLKEQVEQLVTPVAATTISSDIKMEDVQQDARNEDGPQSQSQTHPSRERDLFPPDVKVKQEDSEDEGPPPGWDSKCLHGLKLQMTHPTIPPSGIKIENDQQEDEGPPPGWGSAPKQELHAHSNPSSPKVPSGARMVCEEKNVKVEEERPQPPSRQQFIPPSKPETSVPKPSTEVNDPEMGQMVCGSCRRLLSYPKGSRYVKCICCLEDNYVLEEHEVGQVICGGCNVLLMYPYGAPKVRCVNCSAETAIGDQNRRPPLSEQQRRAKRHLKCKRAEIFTKN